MVDTKELLMHGNIIFLVSNEGKEGFFGAQFILLSIVVLFLKCGKASCGDVENVPNPLKLCWL
jgi:hypothetical protein